MGNNDAQSLTWDVVNQGESEPRESIPLREPVVVVVVVIYFNRIVQYQRANRGTLLCSTEETGQQERKKD